MDEFLRALVGVLGLIGGSALTAWFGRRKVSAEAGLAEAQAMLVKAQASDEQAHTAVSLYDLMKVAVLDASSARQEVVACERRHDKLMDEHEALKRDHEVLKRQQETMREELTRLQERMQAQEG